VSDPEDIREMGRLLAKWDHQREPSVTAAEVRVPDPMEFALSPEYLGRGLYPRQATILKIQFLRDDLMTQYDHDVIGEWCESFTETGNNGIQPDIYERISTCKAEGRPWFRETVSVIGRRGGKNYLGAIAGAYVVYNFLALGDPQATFGLDPTQRLTGIVFGSKLSQARTVQFRTLQQHILAAPCFTRFQPLARTDSLTLRSAADDRRAAELRGRGVGAGIDMATLEIVAKESTDTAGRGPASFMLFFDEGAHMIATSGGSRSMEAVYEAATPSLDQFGAWGFIYCPSSPWQRLGKFFDLYQQALEIDPITGRAAYPEKLMVQLASWDPYKDHERTGPGGIPVYPPNAGGTR
jgi:hypothetical protein